MKMPRTFIGRWWLYTRILYRHPDCEFVRLALTAQSRNLDFAGAPGECSGTRLVVGTIIGQPITVDTAAVFCHHHFEWLVTHPRAATEMNALHPY
jgi:hypothetical protein